MKTADELLTQVNAFLDALPYERTPMQLTNQPAPLQ